MSYIDKEKQRQYQKTYQRKRYEEKRNRILEYLGGKCAMCKSTDGLEVHHIDRKLKKFVPLQGFHWSWDEITAELDNR